MKSRSANVARFCPTLGARTLVRLIARFHWLALIMLIGLCIPARAAEPASTNAFRPIELPTSAATSEFLARQFSGLPAGSQTFHGIPFRINSPISVTGMESARNGAFFPSETSIKIGGSARRIHLLHG